jgi:iron complex outermembrane receptor protein
MPLNTKLTLDHKLGGWSSAIDLKLVDGKSEADPLRQEPTTPGYAIVDLRTAYDWRSVRLDLGITNLFDHQYYDPLGGVALGDYWHNGGTGSFAPLAAMGRSFNAGVTVKF